MSSYNPQLKSWHTFPLLQYLSGKFISSCPSLQFNVVYRDEVTIARSQHCLGGGREFPIQVMSVGIVSKMAFFVIWSRCAKDFVVDCSLLILVTYLILSLFKPTVYIRLPAKIFVITEHHTTSTDCGGRRHGKVLYLKQKRNLKEKNSNKRKTSEPYTLHPYWLTKFTIVVKVKENSDS